MVLIFYISFDPPPILSLSGLWFLFFKIICSLNINYHIVISMYLFADFFLLIHQNIHITLLKFQCAIKMYKSNYGQFWPVMSIILFVDVWLIWSQQRLHTSSWSFLAIFTVQSVLNDSWYKFDLLILEFVDYSSTLTSY